jgi:hypothetical protein
MRLQNAACINSKGSFSCGPCPENFAGNGYEECISLDRVPRNIVRAGYISLTCVPSHTNLRIRVEVRLQEQFTCNLTLGDTQDPGCSLKKAISDKVSVIKDASARQCGMDFNKTRRESTARIVVGCALKSRPNRIVSQVNYTLSCSLDHGTPSLSREALNNSFSSHFKFNTRKVLRRLPPWEEELPTWNSGFEFEDDCPWYGARRGARCPSFAAADLIWTFDERKHTQRQTFDSSKKTSPNSPSKALVGNLTNFPPSPWNPWSPGVNGNALTLNVGGNRAGKVVSGDWSAKGPELTVAVWVRPGAESASKTARLVVSKSGSNGQLQWGLWLSGANDGGFSFRMQGQSGQMQTFTFQNTGSSVHKHFDSTWHHLAAVYNTTDSSVRLYHNGIEKVAKQCAPKDCVVSTSAGPLVVGASNSANDIFYGTVDELFVFSKALTTEHLVSLATTTNDCGASSYGNSRNCRLRAPPASCAEIFRSLDGDVSDGFYQIWPPSNTGVKQMQVYCDMTHGGKTYFIYDDTPDNTRDDFKTGWTLATLRTWCQSASQTFDVVSVTSALEVDSIIRPLLNRSGYDLTRPSGVPLAFANYTGRVSYTSLDSTASKLDTVLAQLYKPPYSYAPVGHSSTNNLVGLGWGTNGKPGLKDFNPSDAMQALVCAITVGHESKGCTVKTAFNYDKSATFDDGSCISADRAPSLAAYVTVSNNLVKNGGFENLATTIQAPAGTASPLTPGVWAPVGPSAGQVKQGIAHGMKGASYFLHTACDADGSAGGVQQQIVTTAGAFYLLEFWASGSRRGAMVDTGLVSGGTLNNQLFETQGHVEDGNGVSSWAKFQFILMSPGQHIDLIFYSGARQCIHIDDVSLKQIQLPGECTKAHTLNLAALGATATASSVYGAFVPGTSTPSV